MIKSTLTALALMTGAAHAADCLPTDAARGYFESVDFEQVFIGEFPEQIDGNGIMITMEVWAGYNENGSPMWTAFFTLPNGQSCLLKEGMAFAVQELPPNL